MLDSFPSLLMRLLAVVRSGSCFATDRFPPDVAIPGNSPAPAGWHSRPGVCWLATAIALFGAAGCNKIAEIVGGRAYSVTPPASAVTVVPAVAAYAEIPLSLPAATDWPYWRGIALSGAAGENPHVPLSWSGEKNIVWKAAVPGRGHSSPAIRGDRIYLATADETRKTQHLLAYDRRTGKSLWNTTLRNGRWPETHPKNTHASASPACDGERVYITFVNDEKTWLAATDLNGKLLWEVESGPFQSQFGFASSPALYKSLVIVLGDSSGTSFLAAHHRQTGEVVWRVKRNDKCSYSSPLVVSLAGKDQLIAAGGNSISAYNPLTGERYWTCTGPTDTISGTPTFWNDLLFVSAGYPGSKTMCLKTDGTGDITGTPRVVWENGQKCYVPSLVAFDGLVYGVTDEGIALCFDAATGKEQYKKRLGGNFSASPIVAAGHLFVPNEEGRMFVYKTGPKFEAAAENDLGDGGFASPVIAGNQIFVRTSQYLYCIGQPAGKK